MERSYDHYKIRDQLGAGKLGRVYLAEDTRTGREVAFKILYEEALGGRRDIKRFEREAKTVGGINHPNIGDVYDVGKTESSRYVVSEFFRGETLRERLDRGQIDIREALAIAIQVASALKETHRARIVHRDIKPENIMLLPGGQVKVTDFGLAKLTGRSIKRGGYKPLIGAEGKLVRSISYMSPEQVRGFAIDRRSDIWGLGALLYEMVSGQPPFDATTTTNVMYSILKGEPRPLTRVPKDLERIVTKALTKSRWHRYQTAKDMAADLEHLRDNLRVGKGQVVINQGTHVGTYESSESFMQRIRRRIAAANRGYGIRVPSTRQVDEVTPEVVDADYTDVEDDASIAETETLASETAGLNVDREDVVAPMTEDVLLHANLWIEDNDRNPIPPPVRLRIGAAYLLLFAIESKVREMASSNQPFVEPPELRESSPTEVEIQVVSDLLKNESGRETRRVKYFAGRGFDPESFALTPETDDCHFVTVRLFYQRTILYRERLRIEVEDSRTSPPLEIPRAPDRSAERIPR